MELRHLRYFVAVAEELHFTRAAARLNIATPTLSAQIRVLETLLGAQLFVRKTRSVVLTQVGERFLAEARATLKQAEQAEHIGRRAARGEIGSIAVGYVLSIACAGLVSSSIREFRRSHPGASFQLSRIATVPQMAGLLDGTLDVGLARAPDRLPPGLRSFVIDRQPFCVAIPEDHPLAARKEIEPEMLDGEPLVATLLEMEMGFISNVRAIAPRGMSMEIVARAPDPFSVLTLVAAGIGLSVLSDSLRRIAIPGVVFRRMARGSRTSDHVVIVRSNEGAPVVRAYIAMLRKKALRP
jgi:DNA-binding transcriptional LysR family regulator